MATIGKGSSGGKEKRGTSPSGPLIKKTPKPSTSTSTPASSSSSPTKEKASSPTDGKPVPNYLKPTISSNLDFSRLPKKSPTDSAQTPIRRRSFDRPPPVSQVQKAIRNVSGPKEIKPLRSSSFSHKSTTSSSSSARPAPDKIYARTVSTLKEGKIEPVMSKSRSLKKSTLSPTITPTTKKSSRTATLSSSSKKKAPKSVTSESSVDHDNVSVDQLVVEDDLVNIEHETQSLPEISDMPDSNQELGDPAITVTDIEVKPIENVEESLDVSEQQNVQEEKSVDIVQVIEETETNESKTIDNKEIEKDENETVETPPKSEQENVPESIEQQQNMTVEEEQNLTVEEKQNLAAEEDKNLTVEEQNVIAEEQNITVESKEGDLEEQNVDKKEITLAEEKKEDEDLEQQVEKSGEELLEAKVEIPNVTATPATPATPDTPATPVTPAPAATPASPKPETPKVQTPNSGKKEKEDYNDVIERTTSKLMGGRKNKVLAMAGAFETVISLEGPKKK